jgi:pimeloyl-ACP methyl ester carboxylesterase
MGFYKENFAKFKFPITIINGSEDLKHISEGEIFSAINQNVKHLVIKNVGHNIHLENPLSFIDCLK